MRGLMHEMHTCIHMCSTEWILLGQGCVFGSPCWLPLWRKPSAVMPCWPMQVRPNLVRFYARRERQIRFFATRDIEVGEELLYDYGPAYWRGREHLELP